MSVKRAAAGVALLLLGLALAAYGVWIMTLDPYDIGRGGLIALGAAFALPGAALAAAGLILLAGGGRSQAIGLVVVAAALPVSLVLSPLGPILWLIGVAAFVVWLVRRAFAPTGGV